MLDAPEKGWDYVVQWSSQGDDLPAPAYNRDVDSPATIAYSSGTTSLPRGVILSHCIWRKAWQSGEYLGATPEDCVYVAVPLFSIMGFLNGLLIY